MHTMTSSCVPTGYLLVRPLRLPALAFSRSISALAATMLRGSLLVFILIAFVPSTIHVFMPGPDRFPVPVPGFTLTILSLSVVLPSKGEGKLDPITDLQLREPFSVRDGFFTSRVFFVLEA